MESKCISLCQILYDYTYIYNDWSPKLIRFRVILIHRARYKLQNYLGLVYICINITKPI